MVKASKEIINSIEGHKFYLYAVNKNMEPIIYLKTIPLFDLMNGRQRLKEGEYPIAHPVLLHNYDLIAKGAGEIVFIKDDDKNIIKGALINNKSGHFRPSPSTLEVVKKIFSQALNISKENIVTIGIEGV
ncbi:hypothetical protein [Anoxybacillus flavithermus]|uniref:hypothetical protein n=1 Tax=Anoxybacillus flavithermus TaxID=33934 RepID=UPI000554E812|nr:hypothetical protein [Anoxybacillus flavithermus]